MAPGSALLAAPLWLRTSSSKQAPTKSRLQGQTAETRHCLRPAGSPLTLLKPSQASLLGLPGRIHAASASSCTAVANEILSLSSTFKSRLVIDLATVEQPGVGLSVLSWIQSAVRICYKSPTWQQNEAGLASLLHYTELYYTILYYTILYYTILYYTTAELYYKLLCYTILYYAILYYTILYYTILYYTIL